MSPFPSLHRSARTPKILLILMGTGLFVASLDAYVVVTAILPMLVSLGISINHLERATPIITGFLLGYLAAMPLAGGLSDRFGRLRIFAACLVLFAAGSILTASAGSLGFLVTGRLLQGGGGGALVPVTLALAADLFPAGDRSPVLGALSALQEVGSMLGPLWGGVIAGSSLPGGWRWIFWLNVPVTVVLVGLLWPEISARGAARPALPLDWAGALLATAALALLTLALYSVEPERSAVGTGFWWQGPLALALFVLFVLRERRATNPLIQIRYFKSRAFTGAALSNLIAGAGLMVALVYIPVLAESPIFSMGPRQAAALLVPLLLGIPVGAVLGGVLARRLRSYAALAGAGMVLAAAGFVFLSGWSQDALRQHLLGTALRVADGQLLLLGLGLGLEIAPVSAALLDVVGLTQRGAGASLLVVMRLVGMLVGFSALVGFGLHGFSQATAHLQPPLLGLPDYAARLLEYEGRLRQAILDQYHTIFRSTAALVFGGALIAGLTLGRPARAR